MAKDDIVVFMTFGDPVEAHLVKGILDDNGLPCFISDENVLSVYPLYNQGLGGLKLSVFERDLAEAARLVKEQQESNALLPMQENNNDLADVGTPVCPVCGSANVSYGAPVRHKYDWLTTFISIFLQVYPFAIRKRYHCFDCGNDFKLDEDEK